MPALPGITTKATGRRENHLLVPRLPEGGTSSPRGPVVNLVYVPVRSAPAYPTFPAEKRGTAPA